MLASLFKSCLFFLITLQISNAINGNGLDQLVYCNIRKLETLVDGQNIDSLRDKFYDPVTKKPCSYLDGSLVIKKPHADFDKIQKEFNSIQVVTGYIHIIEESLSKISLPNLRLIKGQRLYKNTTALHLETEIPSSSLVVDFRRLVEIEHGNVNFTFPRGGEPLKLNIRWDQIFTNSTLQRFHYSGYREIRENSSDCATCDPPYCWGPNDPEMCQIMTRCRRSGLEKSRCYNSNYTNPNNDITCDLECSGGCYGNSRNQCMACAHFHLKNECVFNCPNNTFTFNNFCVDKCPTSVYRFIDGRACVDKCQEGHMPDEENICRPCSDKTGCFANHSICKLLSKEDEDLPFLELHHLQQCENATLLYGSINIRETSWKSIKKVEDLRYLRNLEVITGRLNLEFSGSPSTFQLTSLAPYFSKLREILGIYHYRYRSPTAPVLRIINSLTLENIGTSALTRVNGQVQFWYSPKLAYAETVTWTRLNAEALKYAFLDLAPKGVCHSSCDASAGCFGPGDSQCVLCKYWRTLDHLCVDNCSSTPGWYAPQINETVPPPHRQYTCARCHEECGQTCSGPGANQCIGGCKTYRVNDTCVSKCPHTTYLSGDHCLPCHEYCHHREQTQEEVCTGAGVENCKKCHILLVKKIHDGNSTATSRYQCSAWRENSCPRGYYLDNPPDEDMKDYEETSGSMKVCLPCVEPCSSCTSKTNCLHCNGVWVKDNCSSFCPNDTLPRNFWNVQFSTNASCPLCHPECSGGCSGNSSMECDSCSNQFVQLPSNQTQCVKTCPPHLPVMTRVGCAERSISSHLILTFCGVVIALTIVAALSLAFKYMSDRCRYENEKLKKKAISPQVVFVKQNESEVSQEAPPNLKQLKIIYDDLKMIEALGEGAYGTVYKAEWVERSIYDRDMWNETTEASQTPTAHIRKFSTPLKDGGRHTLTVAVKKLQANRLTQNGSKWAILEEAEIMAMVDHPHCLRLLGICITLENTCLVSEYMPMGSLDIHLRKHAFKLKSYSLLLWSKQIADGMAYLAEKNIVHRDLATRNVLLKTDSHIVITDFGLSKMVNNGEQVANEERRFIPVRWMPPETLTSGTFTVKSDVWSYGITLWEIFTFGLVPYGDSPMPAKSILLGQRLSKPAGCSLALFDVLNRCWRTQPEERPTFSECSSELKMLLNSPTHHFQSGLDDHGDYTINSSQSNCHYVECVGVVSVPDAPPTSMKEYVPYAGIEPNSQSTLESIPSPLSLSFPDLSSVLHLQYNPLYVSGTIFNSKEEST